METDMSSQAVSQSKNNRLKSITWCIIALTSGKDEVREVETPAKVRLSEEIMGRMNQPGPSLSKSAAKD
jgi:hypothetical protein